jgi:hypothetical protein
VGSVTPSIVRHYNDGDPRSLSSSPQLFPPQQPPTINNNNNNNNNNAIHYPKTYYHHPSTSSPISTHQSSPDNRPRHLESLPNPTHFPVTSFATAGPILRSTPRRGLKIYDERRIADYEVTKKFGFKIVAAVIELLLDIRDKYAPLEKQRAPVIFVMDGYYSQAKILELLKRGESIWERLVDVHKVKNRQKNAEKHQKTLFADGLQIKIDGYLKSAFKLSVELSTVIVLVENETNILGQLGFDCLMAAAEADTLIARLVAQIPRAVVFSGDSDMSITYPFIPKVLREGRFFILLSKKKLH